jgi:hypothetical protein
MHLSLSRCTAHVSGCDVSGGVKLQLLLKVTFLQAEGPATVRWSGQPRYHQVGPRAVPLTRLDRGVFLHMERH